MAGGQPPDVVGRWPMTWPTARAPAATAHGLVGLFSGGTLCYEAMTIAVPHLGPIWSNTPLDKAWTLDTAPEGAHVCLDLGEEEYTRAGPTR